MSKIVQDISARDEAIKILTTEYNQDKDFAWKLAATTVNDDTELNNHPNVETITNELYICLRAWLVCSLKNGRPIQPHLIKFTQPNKDIYKSALKRVYEDIIHRNRISHLFKNTEVKTVITEYLENLVKSI